MPDRDISIQNSTYAGDQQCCDGSKWSNFKVQWIRQMCFDLHFTHHQVSSGCTWHLVKLQGSAESEICRIKNVHICTVTLMDSSSVTCHCWVIQNEPSCQCPSWHTVDVTYPQLSSLETLTLGSKMKEYAGCFSQIVTGYKVYGEFRVWKKTATALHLSLQESTSQWL